MGFFHSGGNSGGQPDQARQQSDALIDKQFKANQAEIEEKKQHHTRQRLEIIKSSGLQNWNTTK